MNQIIWNNNRQMIINNYIEIKYMLCKMNYKHYNKD